MVNLQLFKNVSTNYVSDSISLTDWVSMLGNSNYSADITAARVGKKDYVQTKISLPCINYSFLFKNYKKNSNIVGTTGLLYFDIDDPRFNISSIDLTSVCLAHKSFGGVGYTIVVKVEGMDEINYRYYYEEIAKDLGIYEYVDTNAAKQVQTNVLSYDKDVYYNNNSKIYTKTPPKGLYNKKERREKHIERGGGHNRKQGFCFSNIELFDFEGKDYYVDWFNIKSIRCHIPTIKKGVGKRNNMLLAFAANFMVLNPHATKKTLITMLESVDSKGCLYTVGEDRLNKIADSIFKYKRQGTLRPVYSKNRSIIFNSSKKLSVKEKQRIVGEETKEYWKDKSCNKIQKIIDDWNFKDFGKISGRKIYLNHPIGKKTVEKYYKLFKEQITEKNKNYKEKQTPKR